MEQSTRPHRTNRQPVLLHQTEFFDQIKDLVQQTDYSKILRDFFRKNLEDKFKTYKVKIEESDYNLPSPFSLNYRSVFQIYYEWKYYKLVDEIQMLLEQEYIDLSLVREIKDNPKKLKSYVKELIQKYVNQSMLPERFFFYLIENNMKEMENIIRESQEKITDLKQQRNFSPNKKFREEHITYFESLLASRYDQQEAAELTVEHYKSLDPFFDGKPGSLIKAYQKECKLRELLNYMKKEK